MLHETYTLLSIYQFKSAKFKDEITLEFIITLGEKIMHSAPIVDYFCQ